MTEVLTYATEEEADSDLERTFDRNNEVIGELERRFGDLLEVSKWKEAGEEFEVDCVFSLRKIAGKYSYEGSVRNIFEVAVEKHYATLEELVNRIKTIALSGSGYGAYGLNVNPVFYTISKSTELTENEREEAQRKLYSMVGDERNQAQKEMVDDFLKVVEQPDKFKFEGLSHSEIAEFVKLYDGE